jgi:hypothetical protein
MPQLGFEPTIPKFKGAKTIDALDRASTVIGREAITEQYFYITAATLTSIYDLLTELSPS